MDNFLIYQIKDILQAEFHGIENQNITISNFEYSTSHLRQINSSKTAFIAISNARWSEAMGKKTDWVDGNTAILSHWKKCSLVITESPIPELAGKLPQLIVKNSYEALKLLAQAAREIMRNPVIAITGSAGKSSTRLMLEAMVDEQKSFVATRGNHNTQAGVLLYGTKLAANPDYGLLEISLNALNNRGNQSLTVQPTVAIVTSIGEAHLTTLDSKENIALFKSRIIDGLVPNGLMVINKDMDEPLFDMFYTKAKKKTDRIITYSLKDRKASIFLKSKVVFKYHTQIIFCFSKKTYSFTMKMPSDGMISNAFAAIACLSELGEPMEKILPRLQNFSSLDRVMELKEFKTADSRKVDVLDDSHNASIPAMENAIRAFKDKKKFYLGRRILVLGQVADLGTRSQELHDSLLETIQDAAPDFIFGHGQYMRNVIRQLPSHMVGGWFTNARDLAERIPLYCTDDSLVLLKGSITGSDFRQTSHLLPVQLQKSKTALTSFAPEEIASQLRPMWGMIVSDAVKDKRVLEKGAIIPGTLEGLAPILLLFLLLQQKPDLNQIQILKHWPTNAGISLGGKTFEKGQSFTTRELLKELILTQHPSVVYQLAGAFFQNSSQALQEIQQYAKQLNIQEKAVLNLTGRYRVKEQQSYYLEDMEKLAKVLYHSDGIQQSIAEICELEDSAVSLSFGTLQKSYIGIHGRFTICQIGMDTTEKQQRFITSALQAIDPAILLPDGG